MTQGANAESPEATSQQKYTDDAELSPARIATDPLSNSTESPITTPPVSPQNMPKSSEETIVSISTTFFPGAQNHPSQSDLVLLSSDSVHFYVHSNVLLSASQNSFNSLLPLELTPKDRDPILRIPSPSEVLNVLLHAIYNLSPSHYSPTLHTLSTALSALTTYGIPLPTYIRPSTPLFTTLLSHAPSAPLATYALAAHHNLHDLAVSTSPHLLSLPLPSLSDDDDTARTIGPVYLKRLFFLHLGRADALKRLLLPPPYPHPPTGACDFVDQKRLTRAWALASASLAWDARPDIPPSTLEATMSPLAEDLTCEMCCETLRERIRELVVQWSIVKRTI